MFLGANLFVTTSDTKQTSIRVLLAPAGARGCVSSLQTPKLRWFSFGAALAGGLGLLSVFVLPHVPPTPLKSARCLSEPSRGQSPALLGALPDPLQQAGGCAVPAGGPGGGGVGSGCCPAPPTPEGILGAREPALARPELVV